MFLYRSIGYAISARRPLPQFSFSLRKPPRVSIGYYVGVAVVRASVSDWRTFLDMRLIYG